MVEMKTWWNALFGAALLCIASVGFGQADPGQPVIESIDPPDWFVQLPDPMLLIHGTGLAGTEFSIHAHGVGFDHAQASVNGHWAFVWLKTSAAAAQTIEITATNSKGSASRSYSLHPRTEAPTAHVGFSPGDVIYLVMTDRFADGNLSNDQPGYDRAAIRGWHGGDFAGIEQHLDYLQELGVTSLWTTPVYDNGLMPQSYHGYAAVNLYNVDHHFGTLEEYRHLAAALHGRGMKLIIDLVPNHIGVQHPWTKDPPTPDWFHGTMANHSRSSGNFNDLVDPHATPASSRDLTEGWFTDEMPDMNQENPLVSKYLIQNALWWVETAQLDAIRIDTFPYVGRAFWHDFHAALHLAYPNLTTVGEIFHRDPTVTSFFAGGREHGGIDTGLDTPFDFPVYFAVRDVLAGDKPMTELAATLRHDSLYPHPEHLVQFFGNHDTTRFLTAAQGSLPRLKEAIGLLATLRGTPELYSGDEIAMTGGEDPDNRRDFPGGFPSTGPNGQASAFAASGRTGDQQETFVWTAALFAARKAHAALQGGAQQDLFVDDFSFAYIRTNTLKGCSSAHDQEAIVAVLNKKAEPRILKIRSSDTALAGCNKFVPLAPANLAAARSEDGTVFISIPAESFAMFGVW